jgi:hypothetical protein
MEVGGSDSETDKNWLLFFFLLSNIMKSSLVGINGIASGTRLYIDDISCPNSSFLGLAGLGDLRQQQLQQDVFPIFFIGNLLFLLFLVIFSNEY